MATFLNSIDPWTARISARRNPVAFENELLADAEAMENAGDEAGAIAYLTKGLSYLS